MVGHEKKNNKSGIFSRPYIVFLLGFTVLIGLSIPVYEKYKKQRILGNEIKDLRDEISQMEDKKNELDDMITYLESDEFIELEARKKLNYMKEGEEMVIIRDDESEAAETAELKNSETINISKPQKWLRHFFN